MNILAIDAGNTRTKWGLSDGARWFRQSWVENAQAHELASAFAVLAEPERIIVSNVAGAAVAERISAALARFKAAPRWIRSERSQCGVTSSYGEAHQLGPDRWAALIGAWHLFRGPCVVVNAGTAVTVDALSHEGIFLGGFIVAGIELMRAALAHNTANLGLESGGFSYFPDNTADAIMSGTLNALAGSVMRMQKFMLETIHADPLIVLSGGAAPLLAPHLNARVELVDNLVLEGLLRIALTD